MRAKNALVNGHHALRRGFTSEFLTLLLTFALLLGFPTFVAAQNETQQTPDQEQQSQQGSQTDVPEAGGPQVDVGPIAVPRKTEEEKPRPAPKKQTPEDMPTFSLKVDVPVVNLDVSVQTDKGTFIPNLKKDHFRVLEDGVPQKLIAFEQSERPITAVLLVEFARNNYEFVYNALNASAIFANSLKPEDWAAVIAYDMKPTILADFSQDKSEVFGAIRMMSVPSFSETNMFDALYDTLDRVAGIEGHKYIILISSGRDTFSKMNLDKTMKKIKATPDVTIFSISTSKALVNYYDSHGALGPQTRLDFLQADNQLNTFAKLTGGKAYFPLFEANIREAFADIGFTIRNQYILSYKPTNSKQDGTFRKIKVEIADPQTGAPFELRDEKNKKVKYKVVARDGYTARNVVE